MAPQNKRQNLNGSTVTGPRMLHSMTEMPRVLLEMSSVSLALPLLVSEAPQGDGHPVLILPGFTAGDGSTSIFRRFLTQLDYKALPWLQGTNTGNRTLLEGIMRRFYRMHKEMGTKISIVGQSLGGVFAREIAREFPDAVRSVVTLGSPFAATHGTTNPAVEKLFEQLSGSTIEEMRAQMPDPDKQAPLTMPSTAIYSKEDGVVAWQTCIEPETEISENIRVIGSHSGMSMNSHVLHIVADRLAQNPDNWERFDLSRGCRRWFYPPADLAI